MIKRSFMALVITLVIASAISIRAETDAGTDVSEINGTPFCDSKEGIQYAKEAFANGPLSQMLHLNIEDIKNAKQAPGMLANPIRHCSGIAVTNNGDVQPIYYTFEPSIDGLTVQVSKAPPLCDSQIVLHSLYMQLEAEWATNDSDWTLRDPKNVVAGPFSVKDGVMKRNCKADMTIHTATSDKPLGEPFHYWVEMRQGSEATIDYLMPARITR